MNPVRTDALCVPDAGVQDGITRAVTWASFHRVPNQPRRTRIMQAHRNAGDDGSDRGPDLGLLFQGRRARIRLT
jgi:hypothetical protein